MFDITGAVDIQLGRDKAGNLAAVSDSAWLDPSRTFSYVRKDGLLVDNLYRIEADRSGIASYFEYDPNRQLTGFSHERFGDILATFGYGYLADGRVGKAAGDKARIPMTV